MIEDFSVEPSRQSYFPFCVSFTFVTCAQAQITGRVTDATTNQPLPDVQVHVLDSQYKSTTNEYGHYRLDFAPGQFVVTFERTGYFPHRIELNLAQKSHFPAETVALRPSPLLRDIYGDPVDSARVDLARAMPFGRDEPVGSSGFSSKQGEYLVPYVDGEIRVTFAKSGFARDGYLLNLRRRSFPEDSIFVLLPDPSGIYYQRNRLQETTTRYEKKRLNRLAGGGGLRIPIHWEGEYFVDGAPAVSLPAGKPIAPYWILEQAATIVPHNPFEGQHTLRLVRLKSNGLIGGFTAVADDAELIQFNMESLIKRTAKRGLGYQKGGAFRLNLSLQPGIYALCEWTKGVMDKRYRPEKRAWVLEVRAKIVVL